MQFKMACAAVVLAMTTNVAQANMFEANKAIDEENFEVALQALTKSAEVGNAEAQFKLGIMSFQGQAGSIDNKKAVAWFFLASEYEYPQAFSFAEQLFQAMDKEEQDQAAQLADEFMNKYGKATVNQRYYPEVANMPIDTQVINQKAIMLRRGPLHYSGRASNNARNSAMIDNAIRNHRTNPGALNNLNNRLVNLDSGRVVVKYNVDQDGRARSPEVLFSWPIGKFDKVSLNSVARSKFKAARKEEEKTPQFGLISNSRFGVQGITTLKDGYPHLYKQFKSHRSRANENSHAKYIYACFLRAYKPILDDEELEAFEPVLREAAESGHALAQFDYAQYQIYVNDDIDSGVEWLVKAAKSGLLKAEYTLGSILYQSPSSYLKQDYAKAAYWLEKAAKRGYVLAQEKLVELRIEQGEIDNHFAKQAIEWLEEIENEDAPHLYYFLAKLHDVLGDKSEAEDYLEDAIEAGLRFKWDVEVWQAYKKSLAS